jgi:hypothetical protein
VAKTAKDSKEIGKPQYKRGEHPNSKKNLEMGMAKPGDVLNPNGKPPGTLDFKTRFEKKLHAITPENVAKGIARFCVGVKAGEITNADALDATLLFKALEEQDMAAIKEVLDRIEGKAKQPIDFAGELGIRLLDDAE